MNSRLTATIHGWLLLLPAMALLALFTHWPALATFIDSFFSTPRPRRPARFVGLDNYTAIVSDRCSGARSGTTAVRARHHSGLDRARDPDGVWVNDRIAGRTLVRMAYFTRPSCR
jgi:sn-glycerol 3-phosphate transport system permease protein